MIEIIKRGINHMIPISTALFLTIELVASEKRPFLKTFIRGS